MHIGKTILATLSCLGLILAAPAFGGVVAYQVTVNTSSVSGTTGYIDFQLDPGSLGAAGVTAAISQFTGGTLSTNTTTTGTTSGTNLYFIDGDVYTTPPSAPILLSNSNVLTLMNDDPNNELTQAITFGAQLSFVLDLSGPGVSPTGGAVSTSGTNFVLDFLNDAQTAYLLTNDPNGLTQSDWATGVISISNSGLVAAVNNPGLGGGASNQMTQPIPEPASALTFAGAGLLMLLAAGKRRRNAQPHRT